MISVAGAAAKVDPIDHFFDMLNDYIYLLICYNFFNFTYHFIEPQLRYDMGWIVIALAMLSIILTIGYLAKLIFAENIFKCKKGYYLRRNAKHLLKLQRKKDLAARLQAIIDEENAYRNAHGFKKMIM